MKDPKKRPPEFIFFERYDTVTSFGFDDFEQRISSKDIFVNINHILAVKNEILEKTLSEIIDSTNKKSASNQNNESTELLQEIQSLNPGVTVEYLEQQTIPELSELNNLTILRFDEQNEGRIRFLGSLNGRKKEMLLGIIFSAVDSKSILPPGASEWALGLEKDVHLKVFVSHVCPSCPPAAIVCGALSVISPYIHTDIIDVKDFKDLADRFGVIGLPRIVVNDEKSFVADSGPKRLVSDIKNACE